MAKRQIKMQQNF